MLLSYNCTLYWDDGMCPRCYCPSCVLCLQEFVWIYWVGRKLALLITKIRTVLVGWITKQRKYTSTNKPMSWHRVSQFYVQFDNVIQQNLSLPVCCTVSTHVHIMWLLVGHVDVLWWNSWKDEASSWWLQGLHWANCIRWGKPPLTGEL